MNPGRVSFDNSTNISYDLYQSNINENSVSFNNSLKSIQSNTILSDTFFSRKNINYIQTQIIKQVFIKSNGQYRIERQSELQLQIIMRSIYLQYAKHLNCEIKKQIHDLNTKVLEECIDKIITEIKQYLGYKTVATTLPDPLDLPKNLSGKGNKLLSNNIGFN